MIWYQNWKLPLTQSFNALDYPDDETLSQVRLTISFRIVEVIATLWHPVN
ncbi:hypothetical protein LC609_25720 [Nostoc sp. XA013]|nr:hypothetical protein [Nostoc sp. XA013]